MAPLVLELELGTFLGLIGIFALSILSNLLAFFWEGIELLPKTGWASACKAEILFAGSHSRHFSARSSNPELPLVREARLLEQGTLTFPLESGFMMDCSYEKKNSLRLGAWLIKGRGGYSLYSMMLKNCWWTSSPLKGGFPLISSSKIHPKLHMSTLLL